jgi:hypothetical protein
MVDYQFDELINESTYPGFRSTALRNPLVRPKLFDSPAKKLGRVATWTTVHIKDILAHEVEARQIVNSIVNTVPVPKLTHSKKQKTPKNNALDKMFELRNVVARSNEVLASAKTVFPMTLFRDDIVVDRTKITITKRSFFFVSEVMSIRIEDILNVKVSLGPFFGSLTLAVRVLSTEDHHTINFFWRDDAIRLKHIIQGYIIARHNDIDCKDQSREDLIATLTELGHDSSFK